MTSIFRNTILGVCCVLLLAGCGGGGGGGSTTAGGGSTSTTNNLWAWEGGSYAADAGVYGTMGTAAATNIPGARYESVTWTDTNGNLWLFGGVGRDSTTTSSGTLNDLWKFSPSAGQWTWMSGSDTYTSTAVYGTLGTASATNAPGARYDSISWTDASGNLWLFGGKGMDSAGGYGGLNDLWKYSTSTNQWTWVSGPSTNKSSGIYGTLGTPAAANIPGARYGSVSWKDSSGNFWLFGGYGFDSAGSESYLNDMWKYNPSTNQWTWMGGSNTVNAIGVYGTQGAAASANFPGARQAATSWTDASGNFWLFGGWTYDTNGGLGESNDLWKYNTSTNQWTWVSGSNTTDGTGVYGTQGTAASTNVPGARQYSKGWIDASGNLWLFGGESWGYYGSFVGRNDLWKYSPATNLWTWMGGSDTFSTTNWVGAPLGTASANNIVGPRYDFATWTDASGRFWLFGGFLYNDLWMYKP